MDRPTKILIGGALCAVLVVVGGYGNTYRLESKLRDLEAACIEEGKRETLAKTFGGVLVCDAKSLVRPDRESDPSKGIQSQIVSAQRDVSSSEGWYFGVAAAILILAGIPWSWYFLLRRIRELRDAISGK
jgi:hypothetical protein